MYSWPFNPKRGRFLSGSCHSGQSLGPSCGWSFGTQAKPFEWSTNVSTAMSKTFCACMEMDSSTHGKFGDGLLLLYHHQLEYCWLPVPWTIPLSLIKNHQIWPISGKKTKDFAGFCFAAAQFPLENLEDKFWGLGGTNTREFRIWIRGMNIKHSTDHPSHAPILRKHQGTPMQFHL